MKRVTAILRCASGDQFFGAKASLIPVRGVTVVVGVEQVATLLEPLGASGDNPEMMRWRTCSACLRA
jgi:hypothetical protein